MFEYISDNLWLMWLVIAIVCLIIEVASFDFFVTCFALGALGAMVGALVGLPIWMQVLVWAIISILSIWFIRPALTRYLHPKEQQRVSNADALIGREGKVIEAIEKMGYGYVKIDGDEWRALSADGDPIELGAAVRIVARESIIVIVKRI